MFWTKIALFHFFSLKLIILLLNCTSFGGAYNNNYTNQLKSGRKLDDVKKLYNENKRIFIDSIQQIKRPNFINNISKAKANTGLKNSHQQTQQTYQDNTGYDERRREHRHRKIDVFKVVSFVLLLLWIGTLSYFLFFKNDKNQAVEQIENTEQTQVIHNESEQVRTPELNPVPQSELNENDWRNVAKKLKPDTKIEDVVKLIFDKNPTDIKSIYSGQEETYGKVLIEKNKDCFQDKDGSFYFVKDTLKHIPSK